MTTSPNPSPCWNCWPASKPSSARSEEHTSELQSLTNLVCRLLLEKKKKAQTSATSHQPPDRHSPNEIRSRLVALFDNARLPTPIAAAASLSSRLRRADESRVITPT